MSELERPDAIRDSASDMSTSVSNSTIFKMRRDFKAHKSLLCYLLKTG